MHATHLIASVLIEAWMVIDINVHSFVLKVVGCGDVQLEIGKTDFAGVLTMLEQGVDDGVEQALRP